MPGVEQRRGRIAAAVARFRRVHAANKTRGGGLPGPIQCSSSLTDGRPSQVGGVAECGERNQRALASSGPSNRNPARRAAATASVVGVPPIHFGQSSSAPGAFATISATPRAAARQHVGRHVPRHCGRPVAVAWDRAQIENSRGTTAATTSRVRPAAASAPRRDGWLMWMCPMRFAHPQADAHRLRTTIGRGGLNRKCVC
jgi:hypothetical protein